MDTIVIGILSSTVFASIITAVFTFIGMKKKNQMINITSERKIWRKEIRRISESINQAMIKDEICQQLNILKVRINAYGMSDKNNYLQDGHIWSLVEAFENPTNGDLQNFKIKITKYLSLLLKYDWERSKEEVNGNIYYALVIGVNIFHLCSQVILYMLYKNGLNFVSFFLIVIIIPMISLVLYLQSDLDYPLGKKNWKLRNIIIFWILLYYTGATVIIFLFIHFSFKYITNIQSSYQLCITTVSILIIVIVSVLNMSIKANRNITYKYIISKL